MQALNFNKLKSNLIKSTLVKSIEQTNYEIIIITFIDDFKLYVDGRPTEYYSYCTFLDNYNANYFYVDKMPHFTLKELYAEIYRMSNPNTRTTLCKSNYFKSY